jgi:hypothetical protein
LEHVHIGRTGVCHDGLLEGIVQIEIAIVSEHGEQFPSVSMTADVFDASVKTLKRLRRGPLREDGLKAIY